MALHPAASTEQRRNRKDRSSAKTITRALAAERTALAAGGAAHLLQAGRTDVQDTAYVSTGLSQSAHQGTHGTRSLRSSAVPLLDASANEHLAALRLQLGTLCLLL